MLRGWRRWYGLLLLNGGLLFAATLQADAPGAETKTTLIAIRVGGYAFPPYVDIGPHGEPHGLSLELLAALNELPSRYRFHFVLTSSKRRFSDFAAGRFDLILFEDPRWGWANTVLEHSRPLLYDSDRFVTAAQPGRDQRYFLNVTSKSLYGVRGYHYAFAGYETDPELLTARFQIMLLDPTSSSLDRGLQQVAAGKPDLMILTDSYLQYYWRQRPAMRQQLLRAEQPDNEYRLGALVRKRQALTAADLDRLIEQLQQSGRWQALVERYGVASLLESPPLP